MTSDYIVYVDESGDHGLTHIDPEYPVFALVFCIFKKSDYITRISPALDALKFQYWGHNDIVLHAHDIRKSMSGDYAIFNNPETRRNFLGDLSAFLRDAPFHVVSTVIKKDVLTRYAQPRNPYALGMLFCMERLHNWLIREGQEGRTVNIHCEARGKNEDNDLELEFRRICDNANHSVPSATNFDRIRYTVRFLDKRNNANGMQIADLVARPIGLSVLRPDQPNQAFDIIKGKLICHSNGDYMGRGLKVFP